MTTEKEETMTPINLDAATVDAIVAKLVPLLLGGLKKVSRVRPDAALLSMNQAARLLGVSRNSTLHDLIAEKRIRTVRVRGTVRIPRSEIERIARDGC